MMGGRAKVLLACTLVATMLAGCTTPGFGDEDERSSDFLAFGEKPSSFVSHGFATKADDARPWVLGASIDVSDLDDAGSVVIGGLTDHDHRFYMRIDEFDDEEEHMDGGVAADFAFNGASGLGNASLPQADVLMAGWGSVMPRVDDIPYPNPMNGGMWPAYFMVFERGIHDDETHVVGQAAGGPELVVVFYSHEGEWLDPLTVFPILIQAGEPAPVASPAYENTHPFPNMAWQTTGVFEVVLETDLPSLAGTELTFSFVDPTGEVVAEETLGGAGPTARATVRVPMDHLGGYAVEVTGQATAARYTIIGTFEGTEPIVGVLTWEDVLLGKEAKQAIKKWRLSEEHAQLGGEPPPEPGFAVPVRVDDVTPPGLNLIVVAIGVAATILCGLLVTKLAMDSVKGREFQDAFRKRK